MKFSNIKHITLSIIGLLVMSCGGNDDSGPVTPPPPPPIANPTAGSLVFPANNTECNEGTNITATTSDVNFRWNAGENTDSYDVRITNLNNNTVASTNTVNTNVTVTINRGTPYSWLVVSRSNETTQTASTGSYKFYNAGEPVSSYAPFPASVNSPAMGSTVNSGNVTLSWIGEDIDNDITEYDVYFEAANPPTAMVGTTAESSFSVSTQAAAIYYWYIITKDAEGNTSNSEIFEFRTN